MVPRSIFRNMNEQMTLQTLARKLAERHGLTPVEAERFVGQFFGQLTEGLRADQYVKVKGLGTFKLMTAAGQQQVIFQPDATLSDGVNRPFSHFEPVALKETAHFSDLEEPVAAAESQSVPEEETLDEPVAVDDPLLQAPLPSTPPAESETHVAAKEEKDEPAIVNPAPKVFRLPWCMIATLLLVGVLVGGAIVWTLLSGRRYIPASLEKVLLTVGDTAQGKQKLPVAPVDTLVATDSVPSVTVPAVGSEVAESVEAAAVPVVPPEKKVLSDAVKYRIKGTLATHTIQPGESLVKLARKYYGNKRLWTYLVGYNKDILPDADHVPVGLTVRVPELEPVADP